MGDLTTSRAIAELPPIDDIRDLLRFETGEGRIWLDEERTILARSSEMRAIRRELIDTLGLDRAKGVITRMGYIAGQRDAETAKKLRPDMTLFETFIVGAQTHMVTGQAKVVPLTVDIDEETPSFHGVFEWEHSFEAEVFLAEYGPAVNPVCWAQIGYASGYSTQFLGRQILFRELGCQACGEARCRLEGRPAEDWPDAEELRRYYDPNKIADQIFELQSQVVSLRENHADLPGFSRLVGCSDSFLQVRDLVAKAANSNVTVLLLGETGVGKDMFAKALHKASSRSDQPFVAVNCAAIPKDLIEAELFGVERGAFTGADQSREGRFERADGGTLFLDEVGQLSPSAQGALLRVLQEQELERVGGSSTRKVDVRLVAATNEDLEQAVADGRFRADLFYRLNVYAVTVPPLRDRLDDIPILVEHFIARYTSLHGEQVSGITDRAMAMLRSYDWPGNIRELANIIERGVILSAADGQIETRHLFPNVGDDSDAAESSTEEELIEIAEVLLDSGSSIDAFEKVLLDRALDRADGTVSRAARIMGVSRATFDYRLKKAGLR